MNKFKLAKQASNFPFQSPFQYFRQKLSTQKSVLEGEMREVKNKVEVYQTLGSDYESIVAEYTDTVEKLNKQKWLLQQISKKS